MDPMVENFMMGKGRTRMILSGMEDPWTHMVGEAMDMGIIIVLVQTCIMVIIAIILIGGVAWGIFQMNSRKKSHLHSMEK